jgi:predicted  nucleic acid-binding Zn-ribbon protein
MSEANVDDLRTELSRLEAEEAKLSANRERLQNQIDFGFASETTRAREREVSDERRELHRRIDSIRARLGELQQA